MARIATFYDHIRDISRQEEISMTEALQAARAMGVELLETSQNNILGREDEVARELAYAGLGISCIPAYFDFGRDPDVDRQSEPTLEAAKFLGADKLLVIPGFFRPGDSPEEQNRQREGMEEGIRRLAEKAAGYGVSLVMEDYDSELAPFSTIRGVEGFLDRCPGLSCCFDTGNFRCAGEDVMEAYEAFRGRIGHVHLKDRSYTLLAEGEEERIALDGQALYPCPVGAGDLDIAGIIGRLRQDGYDGTYVIEHYGAKRELHYLERSARWVKEQLGIN